MSFVQYHKYALHVECRYAKCRGAPSIPNLMFMHQLNSLIIKSHLQRCLITDVFKLMITYSCAVYSDEDNLGSFYECHFDEGNVDFSTIFIELFSSWRYRNSSKL